MLQSLYAPLDSFKDLSIHRDRQQEVILIYTTLFYNFDVPATFLEIKREWFVYIRVYSYQLNQS
jgi:hypothetical protein